MWRFAAKGTLSRLPLCLINNNSKPINNKHLKRIINLYNSGPLSSWTKSLKEYSVILTTSFYGMNQKI